MLSDLLLFGMNRVRVPEDFLGFLQYKLKNMFLNFQIHLLHLSHTIPTGSGRINTREPYLYLLRGTLTTYQEVPP